MSSLARRLQIRIWKKQGKTPLNHNGLHGGYVIVKGVKTPQLNWPLLARNFNPTEEVAHVSTSSTSL